MKYLNIDTKDLELKGGYYTAKEISSQPEMWLQTYERVKEEKEEIQRLRRENRQLKVEREILKKAAAWFARETGSIPPGSSSS
jgi:transposase-like protein